MIMKAENWKDVVGYEGLYAVSDQGRVKSLERVVEHPINGERTLKERILKPGTVRGYLCVKLYVDGKQKNKRIARTVAEAFLSDWDETLTVDHVSEVKTDNRVENLRMLTRVDNVKAFRLNHPEHLAKTYNFIDPASELRVIINLRKFCRENSLNQGNMFQVHSGKRAHHKNWTKA